MHRALELSDRDLAIIIRLVYAKSGISLFKGKRALVTARLQKRVRTGGFGSFKEYIRYVQTDTSGDELTVLIDAIATNHTSFFREPQHFECLRDLVLPSVLTRVAGGVIRGWSAACATGEEPYSIAMTLFEHLGEAATWRVRLLASDLSTKALAAARAGAYKPQRLADLPSSMLLRYFEKDDVLPPGSMRVSSRLKQIVDFARINLLDAAPPGAPFDFIFCRNVMIYFDREVQQRVVEGLERRLLPGGYLFVSHSESLNSLSHGLTWVAPAVYRKLGR